ncbi:hypothetical protein BAUCODRAFT_437478 [Baudoinia panamericana UAMH 10762]|uniref:Type II toxin-antitoxin system prevent-host-death family antitoxin n=1 Tax=Baudoinia panamericana (strain UAMH 10762) TaxID=717646 RepID=M2ND01_BAUPA|nr:uncharacterized protein BAUCODRAFT_437478 [Baudoinia panamericana UAMH 10762]EMC97074.1 hypothetical protein BAUCODRAFT_437478 [Baudoinia panamericana UAMH 10762]
MRQRGGVEGLTGLAVKERNALLPTSREGRPVHISPHGRHVVIVVACRTYPGEADVSSTGFVGELAKTAFRPPATSSYWRTRYRVRRSTRSSPKRDLTDLLNTNISLSE